MKTAFIASLVILGIVVSSATLLKDVEINHDQVVANVSQKTTKWTAEKNAFFEKMSTSELKDFFGVKLRENIPKVEDEVLELEAGLAMPDSFDARQQWPNCVGAIRNQEHCGSCWAFSASEALADRFCIASNGSVKEVFSPEYLLSCNTDNMACKGGYLQYAWNFMESNGIVTDSCDPYVSGDGKTVPSCSAESQCQSGETFKLFKAYDTENLSNVSAIKQNLMKYGPVQTGMEVYSDFMHYTGGVYEPTSSQLLGGHAVKIVGWGNENGTEYWIIANSWGPTWGESGFFRIDTGVCNVSTDAIAGQASV